MTNIKTAFYRKDSNKQPFIGIFPDGSQLKTFIETYKHFEGLNRFECNIICENCNEALPVLNSKDKTFKMIYDNLYPEFA